MSLQGLIPDTAPSDRSLVLVNGEAPEPISRMLGELFENQPVSVEARELPEYDGDAVVLMEDGSVIASSPLAELAESILLVNSDLFTTGTKPVEEVEVPAVLEGLEDVPFRLWGYPQSDSEKLLLILISRFVERRALEAGSGQLRASFQELSRIRDEVGTHSVYKRLSESDLSVHVYGLPDWIPSRELDVVTHAGHGPDFERAWFVVFEPDADGYEPYGLLAYETEQGRWHGFYTADQERIAEITAEIRLQL